MNSFEEIINSRRSIRKFTDEEIADETIREIISSALKAPSACNSQCYHFVAVKNKTMIEKIALETEKGIVEFYSECDEEYIARRKKQITFFRKAPLVIFVYLTKMDFYEPRSVQCYKDKGYDYNDMMSMMGCPDILSVGAAVENMLLTIHAKGLGACWMNDPIVSVDRISALLGVNPEYRLLSVIPVGKSAYTPRELPSKTVDGVLEII
ncbi:MAG: nitroreductase family protein [Acutalibacteraceae bacterium]